MPAQPLAPAVAYCGLALQDQAHEFGLAPRAGVVERVSEVCPCCRQRDAEAAGSGAQPIAFQYLACEPGFRPSQPEGLAEAFAADDASLLRISDEQKHSRPDNIDPSEPGTVRCHEHGQRRSLLARDPEPPARP